MALMSEFPIPVVTCTIYKGKQFLVIRRRDGAKKFGGMWGFPGGKVEIGETISGAIRREIKEETNLDIKDEFLLVDSYYYGDSLGMHFALFTDNSDVKLLDGYEHKWLSSLEQLQKLHRIPGIDYHIVRAEEMFKSKAVKLSLDTVDYTPDRYIN